MLGGGRTAARANRWLRAVCHHASSASVAIPEGDPSRSGNRCQPHETRLDSRTTTRPAPGAAVAAFLSSVLRAPLTHALESECGADGKTGSPASAESAYCWLRPTGRLERLPQSVVERRAAVVRGRHSSGQANRTAPSAARIRTPVLQIMNLPPGCGLPHPGGPSCLGILARRRGARP